MITSFNLTLLILKVVSCLFYFVGLIQMIVQWVQDKRLIIIFRYLFLTFIFFFAMIVTYLTDSLISMFSSYSNVALLFFMLIEFMAETYAQISFFRFIYDSGVQSFNVMRIFNSRFTQFFKLNVNKFFVVFYCGAAAAAVLTALAQFFFGIHQQVWMWMFGFWLSVFQNVVAFIFQIQFLHFTTRSYAYFNKQFIATLLITIVVNMVSYFGQVTLMCIRFPHKFTNPEMNKLFVQIQVMYQHVLMLVQAIAFIALMVSTKKKILKPQKDNYSMYMT